MGKFRDRRGETLAETLCAVLVLALALTLMAGMISTAARLGHEADQHALDLYQAVSAAEKPDADTPATEGTIPVQTGEDSRNVPVIFYGNGDQAVSYQPKPEGGATP